MNQLKNLQEMLEDGCHRCQKKPLQASNSHIAMMHYELPGDEERIQTLGTQVILCFECASEVEKLFSQNKFK